MDTVAASPGGPARRRRRLHLILLFVLLPAVLGALAVGVANGGQVTGIFDGDSPPWASTLGGALMILGLLVEVAAIVWAVRAGRYRSARHSPLLTLSWSHRRRLARQVRRDEPEADEDPALLVETAEQFVGNRYFGVLSIGLAMTSVGQALLGFAPFYLVLGWLLVLIWTVLTVSVLRNASRGEAFLRAHPNFGER